MTDSTVQTLWNTALARAQAEISAQEFAMWFKFSLCACDEDRITVSTPTHFQKDQFVRKYRPKMLDYLREAAGRDIVLDLVVEPAGTAAPVMAPPNVAPPEMTAPQGVLRAPPNVAAPYVAGPEATASSAVLSTARPAAARVKVVMAPPEMAPPQALAQRAGRLGRHPRLRADYRFDNYIVGEHNRFAAKAAEAVASNPGRVYNPFLIYGGVGLGKTHLMHAVGNHVGATNPDARIVCITAEEFTNEFIQSIHDGSMHAFKNKYRTVDYLLIDDIHFLQKKNGVQEELFHTFNALYDADKQIIFTCDRPVSELKDFYDRLRSRCERGLNVDLQPPEYENRCAILKSKAALSTVTVSDEVIEIIAQNVATNVRDLEAALTKLVAYADLIHMEITPDIARKQLKDMFSKTRQGSVTVDAIMRSVAEHYKLTFADLKGKKRSKNIAFPRQIAMYIIRDITEYSTTEIGMEFGGRDHTTVIHSCQKIEERLKLDPHFEATLQHLIRLVRERAS